MRFRQLASFALLLAVFTMGAQAQSLTQVDRDKAMRYLGTTRQGVIDATKGLSAAQWNFKPAPDRWSVAEVTEHIAAAEDMFRGLIVDKVLRAGARTQPADVAVIDEIVISKVPDRTEKRQAPEMLKPTNRFGSPDASLKHFLESRTTTEDLLKNTKDLREHAILSPFGKEMDAYEWILFISANSERHTKQINEVKADPNFPKQ